MEPASEAGMSISPMIYPAVPGWVPRETPETPQDIDATGTSEREPEERPASEAKPNPTQPVLYGEEDLRNAERAARQKGWQDGHAQAKAEFDSAIAQEREAVGAAIREFARDREVYFHNVEGEVVSLALAIVRKILKREAHVDPMLLSGMVRVALERIGATQSLRLRVHPSQIETWRAYLDSNKDFSPVPELSGDGSLEPNACHIETDLGTTELNLETQLKEIEVGLFDLLAQRPKPK
jgi:flagellar assembly protein FliH